jgi:hypothetical protein
MANGISSSQNGYVDTSGFSGLIDGLLQGHALAQQLHQQQMQDQAFKTNEALKNQQLSIQDIMNKQTLAADYRPVNDLGMIDEPAASNPNPLGPGLPAAQRKPDPSRTVTYQGMKYERKPQEEIEQSALDRQVKTNKTLEEARYEQAAREAQATRQNTLKLQGGGTPAQGFGSVGYPDGYLLTAQELRDAKAALNGDVEAQQKIRKGNYEKLGANESLVDTGASGASGAPASGDFAGETGPAVSVPAAGATPPAGAQVIAQGVDKAGQDRRSREQIAADNRTAANARATNRNATTIEAAGIRRDQPTPGQAGVADRFRIRQEAQAQKDIQAIQAKEDEAHAEMIRLGQTPMKTEDRNAKIAAQKFKVQAFQTRKATIAGAQLPPKAIQDQIPEGKSAEGPDGHTWMKNAGIVYFVR